MFGGGHLLSDIGQSAADWKRGSGMKPAFAALIAMSAPAAAEAPPTPSVAQLQLARFTGMHMAATLLFRGVKATVTGHGDVREQVHEAEGLAYWGASIPGLFPAGSGGGESRARPEIWTNWEDFGAKALTLRQAASRLLQRARAGDAAGFATEAAAVEAACTACHTAYRAAD